MELLSDYERLELIVSSSEAGLWDWQIAEDRHWCSPGFYKLLGFSEEELRPCYHVIMHELLHSEDRPMLEAALEQHFSQKKALLEDIRLKHKSGEYRWFQISGKAAFDASGKPRRMCGSLTDITAHKNKLLDLQTRLDLLEEVGTMMKVGGWEMDLLHNETYWSKGFYKIFEIDEHQPPSLEVLLELFVPEYRESLRQKLEIAAKTGKGWKDEYKLHNKKKQKIWVSCIGKALYNDKGKITGLRGGLQIINKRKLAEQRLQASEDKFRKLFELSPVGKALTDWKTGKFIDFNKAFLKSSGYSPEELKRMSLLQITPEEMVAATLEQVEILKQKGCYGPVQAIFLRKDGTQFPVLANGTLIEDLSGRQLVWSFFQDISDLKKHEAYIEHLNEELREINHHKDRLFSIISHDLKGSVGNTDMLIDFLVKAAPSLPEELREIVKMVKLSSAGAKNLLESLLLWARNQMDKMPLEPVWLELEPVVAAVMKELKEQAQYKQLELVSDIPPGLKVLADEGMLQVILRNLFSNAIKYSYPNSNITLMARETEGMVSVSVQDHGIGMSVENLQKVFKKEKHHTTPGTGGEKGSGLGLMLCQELVQKHGGEITIVSERNKGCTITFTLPKNQKPPAA